MSQGISICILTYEVLFYTRLALKQIREQTRLVPYEVIVLDNGSKDGTVEFLEEQPDVRLIKRSGNALHHGPALDILAKHASMDVMCALCSDAFPVNPEWVTPALYVNEETVLAGIGRGRGRVIPDYVCPSYLFGLTEWVKKHSFVDRWPKADTGELMSKAAIDEGFQIKTWKHQIVDVPGFKSRACDYNGWVWHTWMTGRAKNVPKVIPLECKAGYHGCVEEMLRERFDLDW